MEKAFYYALPEEMAREVIPGKRVIVPFSGRKLTGYVVGLSREKPDYALREIAEVVDLLPLFDGEMLKLTRWVSDYYCSTWGEALHTAFPPAVRTKKKWIAELVPSVSEESRSEFASATPRNRFTPRNDRGGTFAMRGEKIGDRRAPRDSLEPELLKCPREERLKLYSACVSQTLESDKGTLILVPDIFRSKSILEAMRSRFGQRVCLLTGRLQPEERYREWMRMKSGMAKIVIGTRSAVFAPVADLGLIIVDEEDDSLYKEKRTPKYHAREVALKRARLSGARVILGAQAPSLESYFQAEQGKYKLLEIAPREERKGLARVEIADLCREFSQRRARWALSRKLREEIEDRLKRGEQTVLLISRRGTGMQRLMNEVGKLFPQAHLGRVSSSRAASYCEAISLFRLGKTDILIGTHAVLEELEIRRLTLVGIISADTILNIGDFRAAEKAFQLLTRVVSSLSGRQGGKVIIQTRNPNHYSILSASRDNYPQFYREELIFRRQLNYPPFTSLINITVKSDDEAFRRFIVVLEANRQKGVDVLVSTPSSKASIGQRQIIIKGENLSRMREVIRKKLITSRWNKTRVNVDVDPL